MSTQIPVESILKIALDSSNAEQIQRWLDNHEKQWSSVESSIDRIGSKLGSLGRFGADAAGIAGISAIASNLFNTSQYGSNLGLAAGHVTGGSGVWNSYASSLYSAQSKTGVAASEIAQGLIQAVQAVGGNPTPNQAAVLGGLLAGYGQTVGLTPAQVAQVVAPILQAANKPLTAANILGTAATLTSGLSAFPGSQAAPILGLISQEAVSSAIGSGPANGYQTNLTGITAVTNAAAQSNKIWRSPSLQNQAKSSIGGALQGAYSNPQLEAFMQMAGVSYKAQRTGAVTPGVVQDVTGEATKLYGTGNTRDIFLRSIFGIDGADLLEQFSPGSKGAKLLQQNVRSGAQGQNTVIHSAEMQGLLNQIHDAQAATTPGATANKVGGSVLHWVNGHPVPSLLGGAALLSQRGRIGSAAKGLLGDVLGGSGAADEDLLGGLLKVGGGVASLGAGTALSMLIDPSSTEGYSPGDPLQGVLAALGSTKGRKFKSTAAEQKYLLGQFGTKNGAPTGYGGIWATGEGANMKGATTADQMMQKLIASLGGPNDPLGTFNQAVTKLLQYANQQQTKGKGSHAQDSSYALGTTAMQALGSSNPGVLFAALGLGAGGSGSGGTGGLFASYPLSGGAGGGGALSSSAPGSASSKAAIVAAAKRYGIPSSVLEGIYGAESTYGTAYKPGQKTYGDFGLTSKGLWNPSMTFQQDANTAAQTLAALLGQYGNMNTALEHYSGGSYGLAHVQALSGGTRVARHAPTASTARDQPIHVHVHVGGRVVHREITRAKVLAGHNH